MKIALRPPPAAAPAEPRPKRLAPSPVDLLVRELVRHAPDGAAAWERLMIGVDLDRAEDGTLLVVNVLMSPERLAANEAAMAVDHKIGRGWEWIAKAGDEIPRAYLERLCELHDESLDRLAELDAIRRRENAAAGRDVASPEADWLHRACCEAEGYLKGATPNERVSAALESVGAAIDAGEEKLVARAAKRYVRAAVWQRWADQVVEDE